MKYEAKKKKEKHEDPEEAERAALIKELEEFRAKRKIYELTPRKFNKIKGVRKEDLYPVDDSDGSMSSGIDTDDETFLEM